MSLAHTRWAHGNVRSYLAAWFAPLKRCSPTHVLLPTGDAMQLETRLIWLEVAALARLVTAPAGTANLVTPSTPWFDVLLPMVGYGLAVFAVSCALVLPAARAVAPALRWASWVTRPAVVAGMVVLSALTVQAVLRSEPLFNNDANLVTACAAQSVLAHRDPYSQSILACAQELHAPLTIESPIARGPLSHFRYWPPFQVQVAAAEAGLRHHQRSAAFPGIAYPPLATLWMVPVSALPRWSSVVWTLGLFCAWVLLLCSCARRTMWPLVLTVVLLQSGAGTALHGALFGDGEIISYIMMGLAALWLERPIVSSVALALAVGSNQLAWAMVPAMALVSIRMFHDWRLRLPVFVGASLVLVGPWLIIDPGAIRAISGIFGQPTFPAGQGLVALVTNRTLPLLPSVAFETVTLAVIAATLAIGWAQPRLVLVCLPLSCAAFWFNWHSDPNYLSQMLLLATALVVGLWGVKPDRILAH